jgi:RimJ/RimL family protein N-acetyltransferase
LAGSPSARSKLEHQAPVIETARLRLRGFRASDLDAQAAMNADHGLMRLVGGQTHSREDSWRRLLASIGMWVLLGYGHWLVERKEDGVFLGNVGLFDWKRDMTPSIEGEPEMGWFFAAHAHGRGYASEAVAAALAWADRALAGREVVAMINRDNAASIRVAEKAGFAPSGEANYKDETLLLYRRPSPAAAAASTAATA